MNLLLTLWTAVIYTNAIYLFIYLFICLFIFITLVLTF